MTASHTAHSESVSPHRIVMASAGTGKTFRLSGTYLRHALAEVKRAKAGGEGDPASILAMTFTRKAAGEITDRVLGFLAEAILDDCKLRELTTAVGRPVEVADCELLLQALVEHLDRLSISTIDAYFMKIAQAFALELGVPPGWRIADELEDEELRAAAVLELLRAAHPREVLDEIAHVSRGRVVRSVLHTTLRAVNEAYSAYVQSDGEDHPWAAIQPLGTTLNEPARAKAITQALQLDLPRTKAGEPDKRWLNAVTRLGELLQAGEWEAFLSTTLIGAILDPGADGPKFSGKIIDEANCDRLSPLIEHAKYDVLRRLCDQNRAVFRLAKQFDEVYSKLKANRGLYRFDDVPRLLLDSSLRDRLEDIYFRMDARIHHVLLDEFQDTSIVQFRLLEPILDELLSTDEGRSVFCVGDVKQSLYGWRGAEPDLMLGLPDRWASLQAEPMGKSHRSSRIIMDVVNAVFEPLTSNTALAEHADAARTWLRAFTEHSTAKDTLKGSACLRTAPVDDDGEPRLLEFAADRVLAMIEEHSPASIGVLVRTRKHIPLLVHELKRRGVDASQEGGSPLADAPPVAAALSLLQLADFPGDSAAAFHVASGPIGKLVGLHGVPSADRMEAVSADVRHRLIVDGYAATLRWLLCGAASAMDDRGFDRFNHLIDLAVEFDERKELRPSAFVALARETTIEDPSRNRVRVMTIHASKGLEFEGVILPDLDRKWDVSDNGYLVARSAPLRPARVVTRTPNELHRQLHPELADVHAEAHAKAIREELSCLYVAMTRAIHGLEMIIAPRKKPEFPLSASGVLHAALAAEKPCEPNTVLWSSTPRQEWKGTWTSADARADESASSIQLELKPSACSSPFRTTSVSPSSLEAGARRIDGLFSIRGEAARREGTLIHAWCEHIEWLDDGEPADEALLRTAAELGYREPECRDALAMFREALRAPCSHALRRSSLPSHGEDTRVDVRREWAFEVRLMSDGGHAGSSLIGRFDRLVLGWSGDQVQWAEIIDFKSDNLAATDAEGHQASVDGYRPQILAYARAVNAMFNVPADRISAKLVFLRSGLLRAVDVGQFS